MDRKTEVVLSITTGILLCKFGDLHECCEWLTGGPIYIHQFAHRPFVDELISGILVQHPHLKGIDARAVDKKNWEKFRDEQVQRIGNTIRLVPFAEVLAHPDTAFTEPLKGKDVIIVQVV